MNHTYDYNDSTGILTFQLADGITTVKMRSPSPKRITFAASEAMSFYGSTGEGQITLAMIPQLVIQWGDKISEGAPVVTLAEVDTIADSIAPIDMRNFAILINAVPFFRSVLERIGAANLDVSGLSVPNTGAVPNPAGTVRGAPEPGVPELTGHEIGRSVPSPAPVVANEKGGI